MAIQFRVATPHDSGGILAIYGPFCASTHVSFEIVPPTDQQMRDRIAKVSAQYPWLVADDDGEVAGYVYASQHRERAAYRWCVDVAVYVGDGHQKRRIGRGLYTSLFELLRAQGYFQAFAGITLPNPGSVALHESVGFRPMVVFPNSGYKLGGWRDVGWWQLPLAPTVEHPPEPRAFPSLGESEIAAALRAGQRLVD